MLSGFWSRVTQTVFVLDFEPLLRFWTDTILTQTTQSRLFSSTASGWCCLFSLFASKPARGRLGRQPGLARPCLQQRPKDWNLIQKDILRWLLHFLVHSKWMQQAKLNSILQKFFPSFFWLANDRKALKNLVIEAYPTHVLLVGTLCWRARYCFMRASLRTPLNCSWSSYVLCGMNSGDQIHWTLITPCHVSKVTMAAPQEISTIHPLSMVAVIAISSPLLSCPYGSTGKQFLGFQVAKKDVGHSKSYPCTSCETCLQLEQ